jgi:hypothetical protein
MLTAVERYESDHWEWRTSMQRRGRGQSAKRTYALRIYSQSRGVQYAHNAYGIPVSLNPSETAARDRELA